MVALLIIAGVMAIGGTRLFNPSEHRRSQIRKVALQTKEVRTAARLSGNTFRLAFQMDDEKGHKMWAESANGVAMQLSAAQEKELDKLTEIQRQELVRGQAKFEKDPRLGKEIKLNAGLVFEGVEINGREKVVTGGIAYVHFFPQGLSDEALIKIGDRQNQHWTIAIHPLTGSAEILNRAVSLKELKSQ